jgi:hypothetical protein
LKKKKILILARADFEGDARPSKELVGLVREVNGKSVAFTYPSDDIIALAKRAERRLDKARLTQAQRVGFEMSAKHAGPVAKAYKWSVNGGFVKMRRTARGWVLLEYSITRVYPTADQRIEYRATAEQIEAMRRNATADITQFPVVDQAAAA